MQNRRRPGPRPLTTLAAVALAGATLTACGDATPRLPTEAAPASVAPALSNMEAGSAEGLAELRRATARYHRVETAIEDGFVQFLPCLENPEGPGGLGIPYANPGRLDAEIDLSEPEVLFYEPQANGELRLLGGEPVVPIGLWTETEPPSLFGHEFHRNEEHGLYGLHMWVWRHNPDGVFAFWHPEVSCDAASTSTSSRPGGSAAAPRSRTPNE